MRNKVFNMHLTGETTMFADQDNPQIRQIMGNPCWISPYSATVATSDEEPASTYNVAHWKVAHWKVAHWKVRRSHYTRAESELPPAGDFRFSLVPRAVFRTESFGSVVAHLSEAFALNVPASRILATALEGPMDSALTIPPFSREQILGVLVPLMRSGLVQYDPA